MLRMSLSSKPLYLLTLLIVLVGAGRIALFTAAYSSNHHKILTPDSISYIDTADAVLQTGRFAVSPEHPDTPQIMRTPGYPFFIACVFFFFAHSYSWLILWQIVISLGTMVITYRMAVKLWNPSTAVVATLCLALDPVSWLHSQYVLTETLFTCIFTLAVWAGIAALRTTRFFHIGLLSSLLALATLIRPLTYYIMIPVTIFFLLLWTSRPGWQWKRLLFGLIVLLLPWLIIIGAWHIRNYHIAGTTEFSTIQGVNLLFYRGADIVAQRDAISFQEAQRLLGYGQYAIRHPDTQTWSETQLNQRWKHEGLQLIRQHPGLFLKSQVRGLIKMMFDPADYALWAYLSEYREHTGPLRDFFELPFSDYLSKWVLERTTYFLSFLLAEIYLMIVYVGTLSGVWQLLRTRHDGWSGHLFAWTIMLYIIAISAGPEAYSRFRLPLMPLLSMYAGYGLSRFSLMMRRSPHSPWDEN